MSTETHSGKHIRLTSHPVEGEGHLAKSTPIVVVKTRDEADVIFRIGSTSDKAIITAYLPDGTTTLWSGDVPMKAGFGAIKVHRDACGLAEKLAEVRTHRSSLSVLLFLLQGDPQMGQCAGGQTCFTAGGVASRGQEEGRLKEILASLVSADADWIVDRLGVRPFPPLHLVLRKLVEERLMDTRIFREFGMERRGHRRSLPDRHRILPFRGDNFY